MAMNKRKIIKWMIALFALMGILLLDPMNIFWEEVECASGGELAYGMSESLSAEQESIQAFTAQYPYLQRISMAFFLDDNSEKTGVIQISLTDEMGKVIKQADIPITGLQDHCYYDVPMAVRLKKGGQYWINMQMRDGNVNIPGICYTVEESQHAAGNVSLSVNGKMVDGQAVMRYIYGSRPLSNVLRLWFFLVCIGLAVMELPEMIREKGTNRVQA